jgi:hypothetical protein
MLYPAAVTTTGATFLSHVAIILIVSSNTAIAHSQAVPESHLCPICFEQYAAPDTLPRMLVNCGHTFCEPCLRKMLAPLLANKGAKVRSIPSLSGSLSLHTNKQGWYENCFTARGAL